jgi:hypothetical protein
MVDRSAFDRIIQAGGYISVNTGNEVDANTFIIALTHTGDFISPTGYKKSPVGSMAAVSP